MTASRVDRNQPAIVAELRKLGYSVTSTSEVRNGFPDIVVGKDSRNYLFEIKDPLQPPNKRQLTELEAKWHEGWRGQVHVAHSTEEILEVIRKDNEQCTN